MGETIAEFEPCPKCCFPLQNCFVVCSSTIVSSSWFCSGVDDCLICLDGFHPVGLFQISWMLSSSCQLYNVFIHVLQNLLILHSDVTDHFFIYSFHIVGPIIIMIKIFCAILGFINLGDVFASPQLSQRNKCRSRGTMVVCLKDQLCTWTNNECSEYGYEPEIQRCDLCLAGEFSFLLLLPYHQLSTTHANPPSQL